MWYKLKLIWQPWKGDQKLYELSTQIVTPDLSRNALAWLTLALHPKVKINLHQYDVLLGAAQSHFCLSLVSIETTRSYTDT